MPFKKTPSRMDGVWRRKDLFVLILYTLCTLLRSGNQGEHCGTVLWNIMWHCVYFTQEEYQGHRTGKKWNSYTFSVTVLWSAVQLGCLLLDLISMSIVLSLTLFTDPCLQKSAIQVCYKLLTHLLLFIALLHNQKHLLSSFALEGSKQDLSE